VQRFEVVLKPSVERDLRRLARADLIRVLERIAALAADPRPRGVAKLAGAERLYRVRAGDYRIIYEVGDASHQVVVVYVRHRSAAYRDL
jgi:mRNA interferase RelE/StbE